VGRPAPTPAFLHQLCQKYAQPSAKTHTTLLQQHARPEPASTCLPASLPTHTLAYHTPAFLQHACAPVYICAHTSPPGHISAGMPAACESHMHVLHCPAEEEMSERCDACQAAHHSPSQPYRLRPAADAWFSGAPLVTTKPYCSGLPSRCRVQSGYSVMPCSGWVPGPVWLCVCIPQLKQSGPLSCGSCWLMVECISWGCCRCHDTAYAS
jgi:hypothetical protein